MSKLLNNTIFNYLPHSYNSDVDIKDEDELYGLAHNIVIIATQTASTLTEIPFEDFDEEREEAIEFVMDKLIEQKN